VILLLYRYSYYYPFFLANSFLKGREDGIRNRRSQGPIRTVPFVGSFVGLRTEDWDRRPPRLESGAKDGIVKGFFVSASSNAPKWRRGACMCRIQRHSSSSLAFLTSGFLSSQPMTLRDKACPNGNMMILFGCWRAPKVFNACSERCVHWILSIPVSWSLTEVPLHHLLLSKILLLACACSNCMY